MIISPPFLPPRNASETDDVYLQRAMKLAAHGTYPFGEDLIWHGGIHLEAPSVSNTVCEKVRAISDGKVVYIHPPTARPQDISKHVLGYKNWTDDGCVVIRHETAIGANANEKETVVCFFSIYMHLNFIAPAIQVDQAIHRKSEIGQAGTFEGNLNTLHLEIICDDSNLENLIGRRISTLDINRNGRTDSVFGQMYFHLPADTPVYVQRPPLHQTNAGDCSPLGEDLFIGMHYGSGNARISAWRPDGSSAFTPLPGTGKEYSLYAQAGEIVTAFRNAKAPTIPIHSAVYELLRFGRVLGPDSLNPADTPHWREIPTAQGNRWANMNTSAIHCFSDADAPPWRGWHLLKADTTNDSRASVAAVASLPCLEQEHITTRGQAQTAVHRDAIRLRLTKTICKFSTEWKRSSVDVHWQWLTTEGPGPLHPPRLSSQTHMTEPEAEKFKSYIKALCFWDDAKIGISEEHWHFDPRAFIAHFKTCGWLSKNELKQIYPDKKYPLTTLTNEGRGRTPDSIRETYRIIINKVTRKYFIDTPIRMTHFYGQGAVESMHLVSMVEGSATFTRNPTHASFQPETNGFYVPNSKGDYLFYLEGKLGNIESGDGPKFRGRGMKQLTGRENYSKYWVYRRWLNPDQFSSKWWSPSRPNIAPVINNPEILSTNNYNAIDAGAWYWEAGSASNRFTTINNNITSSVVNRESVRSVSRAINGINPQTGEPNGLAERITESQQAEKILMDKL